MFHETPRNYPLLTKLDVCWAGLSCNDNCSDLEVAMKTFEIRIAIDKCVQSEMERILSTLIKLLTEVGGFHPDNISGAVVEVEDEEPS